MGNSCCPGESPCSSAEERSVLLQNDTKATVSAGKAAVEGTCGPDGDEDMRKNHDEANVKMKEKAVAVKEKQSLENGEMELNNTQENGPLVKETTITSSPCKGDTTRAQGEDRKETPNNSEHPHCTLDSHQKTNPATDHWEVFSETSAVPEVNPVSVQDKIPDNISAELLCPEKASHTEIMSTLEPIFTFCATRENDEEEAAAAEEEEEEYEAGCWDTSDNTAAEVMVDVSQNGEEIAVENSQLEAAAVEVQVMSITVFSEENNNEASSPAMTEDSDNGSPSVCEQAHSEVITSHDVSESPPAAELTERPSPGLDHSSEEGKSANSVRESTTTTPTHTIESSKSDEREEPDPEELATSLKDIPSLENVRQDFKEEVMLTMRDENTDAPEEEVKEDLMVEAVVENAASETVALIEKDAETQQVTAEEQQDESESSNVRVEVISVTEKVDSAHLENSEEDLYRAAEDLSVSQHNKAEPQCVLETTLLKVEDRCSLAPAVDILSYSEREWKGNTAKSALVRKGYREMSQRFGSLRQVRGDNYCALRATLFQVLSHSTQLPAWLQDEEATVLLKQLEADEGLLSLWTFPAACLQGDGTGDVTQQLKGYVDLLRMKWRAAVDCSSAMERRQLCERAFQGGEQELGLLEALKVLMLGRAVELHGCMQAGGDVPLFCWLLFARDSSDCPRSFLSNHLSRVGLSAGLEQVEMFLLGYALQCTIQVYRLYKADTEEFVTFYPDDHKDEWPSVTLVTEDDRHYNVPVVEAAELYKELDSS